MLEVKDSKSSTPPPTSNNLAYKVSRSGQTTSSADSLQVEGDLPTYNANRLSEIENKLTILNNSLEDVKKKSSEMVTEQSEKWNTDKKELINAINETKQRTIETLSIFISIFTFVSTEFQMLDKVTNVFVLIGLTFILFGLLAFFPLLVDLLINAKTEFENRFLWIKKA